MCKQRYFDGYLIVDWSASTVANSGKDSIWWCHMAWDDDTLVMCDVQNPLTRLDAYQQMFSLLASYVESNKRVLVGFDFAYGYPAGFSQSLLPGKPASWLSVWEYFEQHIEDDRLNHNNRFEVASRINADISGDIAPFWGCPAKKQTTTLSMRKPAGALQGGLPEFRIAERNNATHSVWKLSYPGAVGSQVMMGLPYLYRLRYHPALVTHSKIWPFETGLQTLNADQLHDINIIHAEIYPSLIKVTPKAYEIKDEVQVKALAGFFADLDHQGNLVNLFAGNKRLSAEERVIVESEEGWILGV
ncbi:MAG: cobalamin biosynthesis protein CbiG [Gammaproteobacteria bacterium]|nr:cobalamin biosynthesis protein CbiG [Gammaproteobacteria bacterium]